ncbi:MAG: zf-HC2 domain-containing protein, partial [Gemmataceae bacterium]
MRCETARTILELNLPRLGEADWRDLDAVEAHLKTCPQCQAWWSLRSREDNRLAREIRAVPVPRHLAA